MQAFIVLGLIPGTNIQINFLVWLILFMVAVFGIVVAFRNYYQQVRELAKLANAKTSQPANLYHTRLQRS